MRLLRIIGLLLVAAVGLLVLVALGARFNDGPVGLFPGGPLQAGLLEEEPRQRLVLCDRRGDDRAPAPLPGALSHDLDPRPRWCGLHPVQPRLPARQELA